MKKSELQKFIKANCEKVKYKTKDFGLYKDGEIIELYKMATDHDTETALLYAPFDNQGCASFCFCKKIDTKNGPVYENCDRNWINVT